MLDDGKLGTILTAAAVVFLVFFVIFLWLFGWGFYISSALGAVAAVTMIWWMGIEDAETIDDEPGHARPVSRPILPVAADVVVADREPEGEDETPDTADDVPAPDETASDAAPQADPTAPASDATRPPLLDAPEGEADDLTRLKGVGPKLSDMLNRLGVWHFRQIAGWSDAELDWIDAHLDGFKGRARRDDWVGQAKDLA